MRGRDGVRQVGVLRTLVLGLITSHSPDMLNLVLVDFKGGATFLDLERARHVAAVITNLADAAHLVARMSDALAGNCIGVRNCCGRRAAWRASPTTTARERDIGPCLRCPHW